MLLWEAEASGPQLQRVYTDGTWVPVLGTHDCVLTLPLVLGRPHPHRLLAVSSATPQASWTVGTVSTSQLPLSPSDALGGALVIQQLIPRKRSQSCGGAVTSHPSPRSSLHQRGCVQTALPCSESLLSHIPTAPLWVGLVTCPLALGLSLPFWILSSG